jgi:hypothetical protein
LFDTTESVQVMVEDLNTSKQYRFDLQGQLIRDEEHDGWKEIPVTPDVPGDHSDELEHLDASQSEDQQTVAKSQDKLPG